MSVGTRCLLEWLANVTTIPDRLCTWCRVLIEKSRPRLRYAPSIRLPRHGNIGCVKRARVRKSLP